MPLRKCVVRQTVAADVGAIISAQALGEFLTILVTGGAGFIGANFVLDWLRCSDETVVNVDKLTYAGNLCSIASVLHDQRHCFVRADINDSERISALLAEHTPRAILHFAAESHVDRSIAGPEAFLQTNTVGTFRLLDAARTYFDSLGEDERRQFRLINVSTDEVFGSLDAGQKRSSESSRYAPNSPYSASKAAADHFVRAFSRTYSLPVMTSHCSNNFGPRQFPEKLVPLAILSGLRDRRLPIYGDGQNVRDWIYVGDHCSALRQLLEDGEPGETYNIGSDNELSNLAIVNKVADLLDETGTDGAGAALRANIEYVADRPAHDRRYALDTEKISSQVGWQPNTLFEAGLRETVIWYRGNPEWVDAVEDGSYRTKGHAVATGVDR